MDENKIEELLVLTRDNNKILKDIWILLHTESTSDDLKNLIINVIANQIGGKR